MMRNKLFTGLALLLLIALFSACASKKKGQKDLVLEQENTNVVQYEEAAPAVEVEVEEEAPAEKEASKDSSKKNYTGWISSSIRPVSAVVGNVKLNAYPKKGTFAIAVMNSAGKAIPVISSANEYTTTSFYLRAGKKIVKLSDDSNVTSAAKKTANGLILRYTVEKTAIVQIEFECFASGSEEEAKEDSVKIIASVQSLAKKNTEFALKLVLDTVLGETDRHHFYTKDDTPVKNEVLYRSVKEEKYFVSRNAKASMQVILDGADISPIDSLALANYATLDTKKWEADMSTFRSFDTVLSYNNSALAIYWPAVKLEAEQENSNIFYLSFATNGEIPGGAAYISSLTAPEEESIPEGQEQAKSEKPKEKEESPVQNIQAVKEEAEKTQVQQPAKVEEKKPEETKAEAPEQEAAKVESPEAETPKTETPKTEAETISPQKPAVKENPALDNGITNDKLSLDYIQKLLDRIESLEEGDPSVNKDEINALNAELDAILTILNAN